MTIAIGTDILELSRIEDVFSRQGEKLAKRILRPNEFEYFENIQHPQAKLAFLGKRWCAKEAVAKALGTGIAKGIGWQQIEIGKNELGAPFVTLFDEALERLHKLGAKKALISISDERHYAVAYCCLV